MLGVWKNRLLGLVTFVVIMQVVFFAAVSHGQLRKIKVGDGMPEFALPDANGTVFEYKHAQQGVLGVAFLSPNQKRSEQAAAEIVKVLEELQAKEKRFDFIGVITRQAPKDFLESYKRELKSLSPILLDTEYKLWGQLGIIATPTVVIVGNDDKVSWIKAGYGYDFAPALRLQLSRALGITGEGSAEASGKVKTLTNATVAARVRRHLQTAEMLARKGRLESAIEEARKAQQADPNSIDAAIVLGELHCKAGESEAAIEIVGKIEAVGPREKAKANIVLGWANRQMGKLEGAEKLLLEGTKLNPKSIRGFYELGKVYQARGESEKAMLAYYRALALRFGEPLQPEFSQQ